MAYPEPVEVAYTATNADLLYKLGWEELTN